MYHENNLSVNHNEPREAEKDDRPRWKVWLSTIGEFFRPPPCPWGWQTYLKLLIILLILGGLVSGIIFNAPIRKFLGKNGQLSKWVNEIGWWGPVIYAAVYAATTVAFIPGTVLTLAAGWVFVDKGVWVPFLTISAGSTIGAILAFFLGRTVMRNWVMERVEQYPRFGAVDKAIEKGGWWMVFLLRLSPVIPFNFLNYALSLTGVNAIAYSISSWIGMMPGTFLYVYISWTAARAATRNSGSGHNDTAELIKKIMLWGVAPLVTIIVVIAVTWLAKREIDKAIRETEEKHESQDVNDDDVHHSYHMHNSDKAPLLH